ncbi:hypothetical protein T552_01769 [Pneumocystis carinii B80]|uniref:Uncharacterized protein n=1 Tax=Pneumocystis carinii (strain B80) TaxID=1408658 RepID=A0A0W4ZJG4_PNEC8|nr:hypothetical protein T552_01769 [Pneumocystis carinii B80]KTW28510.1 hypothetical protein T552_01769 [Pneumocystis carinii B80]
MDEDFLKLENIISKTIKSFKTFITLIFNYTNTNLHFLKRTNQITIDHYNLIENSIEDISNNRENISDIYKNIDNYLEKIETIKNQVNILEQISNELNKYSKELELKCQELLK